MTASACLLKGFVTRRQNHFRVRLHTQCQESTVSDDENEDHDDHVCVLIEGHEKCS